VFRCGEVARESNAAANRHRCSLLQLVLVAHPQLSRGPELSSARVHPLGDTVASLGLQGTDQRLVRVGRACIAGQAALHHAGGRSSFVPVRRLVEEFLTSGLQLGTQSRRTQTPARRA